MSFYAPAQDELLPAMWNGAESEDPTTVIIDSQLVPCFLPFVYPQGPLLLMDSSLQLLRGSWR